MPSTKRFAELTFAALAAGIIFAAGQATRLGWLYFNTFSYKDFLLYALLLIPIIFIVLAIKALLFDSLALPFTRFYRLLKKSERRRIISEMGVKYWLALIISSLEYLVPSAIILVSIFQRKEFMAVLAIGSATFVILITLRTIVLQQPFKIDKLEKNEHSKNNHAHDDTIELSLWITGASVFIFCAGAISVDIQDLENVDSAITFNESTTPTYVNILASNSNSIVYWHNEQLHISSRSNIHTVTKLNSYSGSRKKQADSNN